MSKLITVFGATGQQGGAVLRALLAKGGFQCRGLTRNPDSDKAKALREKGVEVVKADLDDPSSVEAAIKDAYGVYLVTNFWEHMNEEKEIAQGKTVVDACKKAGVEHLVFSGLEPVKEVMGKPCPHFDGKAAIQKYADKVGQPNTGVRFSAYYEVFGIGMFYHKLEDGTYVYTNCMEGPMYTVSVEECGPAIVSIFEDPKRFIGEKVGLAGDRLTIKEYVAIVAEATGKTINVNQVSYEEYSKLFPGADDAAIMFEYYKEGGPVRDLELTKELNPNVTKFKEQVENNKQYYNFK